MEAFPKNMDFRIKHWLGYTRRFPSAFPLASANLLLRKASWVRHTFDTCNFSVILRGRGSYQRLGVVHPVVAPCVITQWPGEPLAYGPDLPHTTWDEFYLIYGAEWMPRFEAVGLVDRSRPVWPVHDHAQVRALVDEFTVLARSAHPERLVDRADRIAERIVVETLLAPEPAPVRADDPIDHLIEDLRGHIATQVDFDALATRHGMSRATFRRRWAERLSVPPARHLLELRMREACRLLAETNRPVREIARAVGFDDELYFSRRFRHEHGLPPVRYRRIYALRPDRSP
jgi:AraC-like DNA-binding protein